MFNVILVCMALGMIAAATWWEHTIRIPAVTSSSKSLLFILK